MNKQLKKLFAINIISEDPHAPFVWPESFRPAAKWKGTDCDLYLFYWFPFFFIFLINVSKLFLCKRNGIWKWQFSADVHDVMKESKTPVYSCRLTLASSHLLNFLQELCKLERATNTILLYMKRYTCKVHYFILQMPSNDI